MTASVVPTGLSPTRERVLLYTLMALQFTAIVDFMIMMPLSAQLMAVFHIQPAEFGLLVSSYSFAASASALLASSILDRFDRRHALLTAYIGLIIATAGCALANSYVLLLLARVVAGIFGGVMGSIVLSIVGDIVPVQRRGRAMGIVMLAFSLAAVAGVPLGLFIANHFTWQSPFIFLVLVSTILLVVAWKLVPNVRDHIAETPLGFVDSYIELLSVPNHWWAFATSTAVMFAGFMVIPYIAPTLVANAGLSEHNLPYIYLVGGAVTLISRPWLGRLTDQYRPANVLMWTIIGSFLPIILMTQGLRIPLWGHLIIAALFFIFVSGRFIPASALVTASCEPRTRGRVMAFNSAMQNFGSGLAALVAGALMVKTAEGAILYYDWVGFISCGVGIIAILTARKIKSVS